jgi:hypothetical protein
MTDDLVKRLQNPELYTEISWLELMSIAADRIERLEYALRSIAETPIGAEIPDRTTLWGLAVHMRETAKDALKGGDDEQ